MLGAEVLKEILGPAVNERLYFLKIYNGTCWSVSLNLCINVIGIVSLMGVGEAPRQGN